MLGLGLGLNRLSGVFKGIIRKNLQLWLDFTKSEWVGGELVVKDKSPNTNNAKLFTGKALSFNGNDSVDIGGALGLSGAFSIAFWVNLTNYTEAVIVGDVANKDWFRINSGGINYTLKLDGSSSSNIETGANIPLDTWKRVVLIRNSSNLVTLAVDGIIYTDNAPTRIGDFDFNHLGVKDSDKFMSGLLSDVQVYNKAWDSDDVAFDYNNPNHLAIDNPATSLVVTDLKGYWALSEGAGSIAYDSSGQGNNGTITGATYVDKQDTIPQLGMMDWAKSGSPEVTLIEAPNNKGFDILNNPLRLRENAFNLDGSGYGEIADSDSLDFGTGEFSIESWVRASNSGGINVVLSLGANYNNSDSTGLGTHSTGKFLCYVGGSAMYSDSVFIDNDWYHLVVTRDSVGLCTLYVDSQAQLDTETNTNSITNSNIKKIGRDDTSNRFYTNLIDEPRIYNRALTATEINNNYNIGLADHS